MEEKISAWLAYASAHRGQIAWGVGLFLVSLLGSLALVTFVLVRLPVDYLSSTEETPFMQGRHAGLRLFARIGRNLAGVALVVLGVLLSLPGVPGQGALTILIGIMCLDIPGKRKLEHKILGQPRVFASVNKLRARFDKPPLEPKRDDEKER
ncbi:hypothetical protein [Chondromyces crocatus]|uniref:Transmembrane protein (PGPGW) n=1 Tax=Chondromyces crocatus TaxID=52 RepID=A0A0K1E9G0_CHOCO|nr:hypothetical protein [Chondromyces crocatus]AKT37208.1 uncharacterized protein CMC5_013380 [Chondromyces crocatus]